MDILIFTLDDLYLRDSTDCAHKAYKNFDNFQRPDMKWKWTKD